MITGNGYLALPNGRRLDVVYKFSSDHDDRRAGYLLCDTTETEPQAFYERLLLICEDGATIVLTVLQSGDRHLGVIGRVLQPRAEA